MYEGRTRGKRIRYTFSDEEEGEDGSDAHSNKRSTRHSGVSTPAEPVGPTFTASGRQVKSRVGGMYGEAIHSGQQEATDEASDELDLDGAAEGESGARPRRSGQQANGRSHVALDDMDDESDAESSGNEWDGGDDELDDNIADDDNDEDVDMSDDSIAGNEDDTGKQSLVVSLRYPQGKKPSTALQSNKISPTPGSALISQDVAMANGQSSVQAVAPTNGVSVPAVEIELANGTTHAPVQSSMPKVELTAPSEGPCL